MGRGHTLALGGLAAAASAVAFLLSPPNDADLVSEPRPAHSYAEALGRLDTLRAADADGVNPTCRLRLLSHDRRVGRVVVLLHGLTNCPQQFEAFGELLYGRGANVLIARLPHHGLADRLTGDLGRLTAPELARFCDQVVDIACGLGDSVTVAGLSLGGSAAAWIGQERGDVDRVVAIAPLLGVVSVWPPFTPALTRALLAWPDQLLWWDSKSKERVAGPPYVYPHYSTRAVGETLRLGLGLLRRARIESPRAASLAIVTVGGDGAVSNDAARDIARAWKRLAAGRVGTYEFPTSLHLGHDLIDPLQPYQRVDVVYPVLADLMWR